MGAELCVAVGVVFLWTVLGVFYESHLAAHRKAGGGR